MKQIPRICIAGAAGRMGRMLIGVVMGSSNARIGAVSERMGHPWVGKDLGRCIGMSELGITVHGSSETAFKSADAAIDFTSPKASVANAAVAADQGCVHVIGTTGFSEDDLVHIAEAAKRTAIVRAGNMSLGVNLMTSITEMVAKALDADFDIEIVEAHHRDKVDAPSGTALMLGEAASRGRGVSLRSVSDRGRDGITGPRERGHIGFSAVRGGNIVGEHDVMFTGNGERLILRHIATDRTIYANGALKAALWGLTQQPGEYDMKDVLGL